MIEETAGGAGENGYTTAVLKLVSTKTSHVLWAEKIKGTENETRQEPTQAPVTKYDAFAQQLAQKLDEQLADEETKMVFDFSQLDKQPEEYFDAESFLDSLVIALTKSRKCTVVDRKTLDVLFKEQNLVLDGIVSQEERSRLAKIWGVDAFIYGNIWECTEGTLEGTMMSIDIETGQVFFGRKIVGNGSEVAKQSARAVTQGDPVEVVAEFRRLRSELDELLKTYRFSSQKVTQVRTQVREAADQAASVLRRAIEVRTTAYEDLTQELLPSAPQARALKNELDNMRMTIREIAVFSSSQVMSEITSDFGLGGLHDFKEVRQSGLAAVAITPDAKVIVTGSRNGSAVLWDMETGTKIGVYKHGGNITGVAIDPDGEHIATASGNGTAILWNAVTGEKLHICRHAKDVITVAFLGNSRKVLSGSSDGQVAFWGRDGEDRRYSLGHTSLRAISLSSDSSVLVTVTATSSLSEKIAVWETIEGAMLNEFDSQSVIRALAISPDGQRIAAACVGGVGMWDVGSGQRIAWHDSPNQNITRIDPESGQSIPFTAIVHWNAVSFAQNGKALAFGWHVSGRPPLIQFFDPTNLRHSGGLFPEGLPRTDIEEKQVLDHTRGVTALAFALEGKLLLMGLNNNYASLRNVEWAWKSRKRQR